MLQGRVGRGGEGRRENEIPGNIEGGVTLYTLSKLYSALEKKQGIVTSNLFGWGRGGGVNATATSPVSDERSDGNGSGGIRRAHQSA